MQRRLFLKNFFLFTGGGILSAYTKPFAGFLAGDTVSGKITSAGRPLANVVVSDGYSVVTTNRRGEYSLAPHKDAAFISVSTPAGYDFPHEEHISRHYRVIAAEADKKKIDFSFVKLDKNDSKHSFVIWADPQVRNAKDVSMLMNESVPDMQEMLSALPAGTLIHGICVGDIVWDTPELYPDYNKAVKQCGIPFYQALGNHDMDYRQGDDTTSDKTFKSYYGPTYYSFNRGKVHYVVLDDVLYLGKEREYKGFITQNQLDWLKKDLELVPKDHLLIINLHIPVHSGVENNKELYALLQPFSKCHIMSGHTHYNRNVIKDGIYEHNHGTVCGAWWTGPICEDGTPDGYGIYEVDGTDLKWQYKSTGFDKNHQAVVYVQKNETGQDEMVANVFNWDPEWKVEWWLDDNFKGQLTNKTGLDPLAVKTMKGPALPVGRAFAEPKKTDHLFIENLPASYKKIRVRATDRFGNAYEAVA